MLALCCAALKFCLRMTEMYLNKKNMQTLTTKTLKKIKDAAPLGAVGQKVLKSAGDTIILYMLSIAFHGVKAFATLLHFVLFFFCKSQL